MAISITLEITSLAAANGLADALDLFIEMESERATDKAEKVDTDRLNALKALRKEIR